MPIVRRHKRTRQWYRLNIKEGKRNPIVDNNTLLRIISLHHTWYQEESTFQVFNMRHYGNAPEYTLENAFPASSSKSSYSDLVAEAKRRGLTVPPVPVNPFLR